MIHFQKHKSTQKKNNIKNEVGDDLRNISYGNLGNHNENQFFNLNKSTDKKSKRHFVPIEEMKNQNNLKKSSKTIRPNKNSINNIKVSKSNQQIGKGFSVQASILKKKLKCNYSKTCKNFNVRKLLKMNNYEDLKVDIAFF